MAFGAFEELFVPGARHRDEERNRLALTREQDGEGEPHRGPIDLERGAVVIRVQPQPKPQPPAGPDADPDAAAPAAAPAGG